MSEKRQLEGFAADVRSRLEALGADDQVLQSLDEAQREAISASTPVYTRSISFYILLLCFLGTIALVCLIGGIILRVLNNTAEIPDMLVSIGSAAVGALAGLLVPTPGTSPDS